jgi:2-iminobutanoate/2-iminopropanoate deaminase
LFVSGQLPIDLKGRTFTGDFKAATNMCLGYIKSILQDAGFLLNEVVRCDVYLTDLQQQGLFEQLYQQFFRGLILPARVIVGVQSLPGQASIMIAAVACKPSQPVPQAATTTMEDEEMYDEY